MMPVAWNLYSIKPDHGAVNGMCCSTFYSAILFSSDTLCRLKGRLTIGMYTQCNPRDWTIECNPNLPLVKFVVFAEIHKTHACMKTCNVVHMRICATTSNTAWLVASSSSLPSRSPTASLSSWVYHICARTCVFLQLDPLLLSTVHLLAPWPVC